MNRRQMFPLLTIPALLLSGCVQQKWPLRYRLTLEMDTPEGVNSASSVIETTYLYWPYHLTGGSDHTFKVTGEAIFLDLGGGKNAVMLLTHGAEGGSGDGFIRLPMRAHGLKHFEDAVEVWKGRRRIDGVAELKGELIPTIITFTDVNDPASAKVIHAVDYRQQCADRTKQMPNCQPEDIPVLIDEIATTWALVTRSGGRRLKSCRMTHHSRARLKGSCLC